MEQCGGSFVPSLSGCPSRLSLLALLKHGLTVGLKGMEWGRTTGACGGNNSGRYEGLAKPVRWP